MTQRMPRDNFVGFGEWQRGTRGGASLRCGRTPLKFNRPSSSFRRKLDPSMGLLGVWLRQPARPVQWIVSPVSFAKQSPIVRRDKGAISQTASRVTVGERESTSMSLCNIVATKSNIANRSASPVEATQIPIRPVDSISAEPKLADVQEQNQDPPLPSHTRA